MLAEEIKDFLVVSGVGNFGSDLFIGPIPPQATLPATGIIETGGAPPAEVHDMPGVAIEYPSFQLTVRGDDDPSARTKIHQAWDLLVKAAEIDPAIGTRYLHIGARQSPQFLALDDNNNFEYVANFDCVRIPT